MLTITVCFEAFEAGAILLVSHVPRPTSHAVSRRKGTFVMLGGNPEGERRLQRLSATVR
jgi:hypothetical protein